MLQPGPDHPITIEPARNRWRALYAGHVIADTADALILREASLPPVVYFPREDVGMEYMARTERTTHCPYKGDAAYYTLAMDGQIAENAVWTYERPFPAMDAIAGRLAFYADRVEVYEVDDAAVGGHARRDDVDAVVQHTDAGDGTTQREHWPATAANPDQPEGGVR